MIFRAGDKEKGGIADEKKLDERNPSPESVETEPAIISASIIREAPIARAKASTEAERPRAVPQKESPERARSAPRTRNTLFIR